MKQQHHYLSCETEYFNAIERGEKKFEIRINDRNFQKHDMVYLQEIIDGVLTDRDLPPIEIQYVLHGGVHGLDQGYCIFNW